MSDKEHDQAGHGHGGEAVYPYTPHHFHSAKQHLESGKLGVWLFLVTEILFFAGLFCAYTVYRSQYPEVFYWAHFYLDTKMGAINTVVLILSSFTAAWAVRNAQLGQKGLLRINILVTIACAMVFMVVKYVEYSHKFHDGLLPARHFDPKHEVWETPVFKKQHPEAAEAASRIVLGLAERKNKQAAVSDTVLREGTGLELVPVVDSPKASPDAAAPPQVAEPTQEVQAADAEEVNPAELAEGTMVGLLQDDAAGTQEEEPSNEGDTPAAAAPKKKKVVELSDEAWLERQIRSMSAEARHPLEMAGVIRKPAGGVFTFERPAKAGVFFSIYFFMTGLHGIHVLVGIGLWIWMLVIASRRKLGSQYFGPIEFTALYWHLVDLIWIYLFPLLYLIH